jgi:hypothetical protein
LPTIIVGACGTVRAGDTAGPVKKLPSATRKQLAILFHPGDKLLDAADVIVGVPAAKAVQRRFQHHHFRERDNGHQIIAIGVVSAFCNCCSSAIALSTPSWPLSTSIIATTRG